MAKTTSEHEYSLLKIRAKLQAEMLVYNTAILLLLGACLTVLLVVFGPHVSAVEYDDRKSPPPLPRKVSCLKVIGKPRCIPISRRVIDNFGLVPGQSVSAKKMFKIFDANELYIKNKLR